MYSFINFDEELKDMLVTRTCVLACPDSQVHQTTLIIISPQFYKIVLGTMGKCPSKIRIDNHNQIRFKQYIAMILNKTYLLLIF